MKHRTQSANRVSVVNSDGHVIGIDLGATAVRAAVLAPKSSGRQSVSAHGLGSVPLPDGAVVAGAVVNPSAVTAALKLLWTENKFNCKRVVLGVTSQQVVVRDQKLPNLSPDQLRKTLPFQARDVIALPLEQALLDFSPVGPPDPATNTVTGLLTGIPKAPVVAAVNAVEKAGLTVARVDLAPFGLLRSIGTSGPAIEALIDIGAHLTTIVIHTNGIARVVRVLPRGGAEWTTELMEKTDISLDEAEATKKAIGITGTTSAARTLKDAIRPVVTEIRGSIHFFAAQQRTTVERLALTGGSAALPGLAEYLREQLNIEVDVARPMRHIADAAAQVRPGEESTAVAIGLAMGNSR